MRNSGVVITNLVFMILALILGTVSYFLFNNVSEKKQEIAAAQKALSDAKSENSAMTSDFAKLKAKLGYEDVADAKELDATMAKDIADALGKTEANATYRDVIVTLGENLADKVKEYNENYVAQRAEANRVAALETKKTEAQKGVFDEKSSVIDKDHTASLDAKSKNKQDLQASFDEQGADLNRLKDETKKEIAVAKQETADFKESKEKFAKINEELSARVDELSNASYERADAEILYADQVLKLVRLNVGACDGVRPLTTFNVFAPDTLDMTDASAKGSVQVVRTIGEHMCEAKILEDEMSNPVQRGDLVYTPLWRPGEVMRYALDYHLDINGDGFSDLNEVITLIRTSGAEVAAYIDDDGKIQNEDQIGPDVYRVVTSGKSISDLLEKDYSKDDATKEKIANDEVNFLKAFEEAKVPSIELKEFLEKIGYKETAGITRYREEGGVSLQENGVGSQIVSPGIIAPTYVDGADKAPRSPGILAPTYIKDADKAPKSSGTVSPYYTRQHSEKK